MSFLKAEWRKLAIANYAVDKDILSGYLPTGTELDMWNHKYYISLVGFMFINTRILGIKVPGHINFEEVNLRFYVKRHEDGEWKRGVVFIKEIVPKKALTFVANTVYNENYETLPMKHFWKVENNKRYVEYQWRKGEKWNEFLIEASEDESEIQPGSKTEFITEHYWGYAKVSEKLTNEYEVTHPKWKKYEVLNYKIEVDFGSTYGKEFDFLNSQLPDSVMLAEGSEITVEKKKKLKNAFKI